jgi:hypothetical protein
MLFFLDKAFVPTRPLLYLWIKSFMRDTKGSTLSLSDKVRKVLTLEVKGERIGPSNTGYDFTVAGGLGLLKGGVER